MSENGYYPLKNYFSLFELTRMHINSEGCYYKQKQFETFMIIGGFFIVRTLLLKIIFKIEIHKGERLTDLSKK